MTLGSWPRAATVAEELAARLTPRFVHIWTLADGKVARYDQLADTRKFCDAVGK